MAKRRQVVEEIVIDKVFDQEDKDIPKCLGQKEEYCSEELCGKWFSECSKKVLN